MVLFSTLAYAGVFGTIKGWISGQVMAYIASAVLALVAGGLGVKYKKALLTIKEVGEFIKVLTDALEDDKLTKTELKQIAKEGKDIIDVWV